VIANADDVGAFRYRWPVLLSQHQYSSWLSRKPEELATIL
jgi:putative SOS response-associated peptidase YedK